MTIIRDLDQKCIRIIRHKGQNFSPIPLEQYRQDRRFREVHPRRQRKMSKNSKAISFRIKQMIRDPPRSKIKSKHKKKSDTSSPQIKQAINKPSRPSIYPANSHSSQQQKHHPSLSSTQFIRQLPGTNRLLD